MPSAVSGGGVERERRCFLSDSVCVHANAARDPPRRRDSAGHSDSVAAINERSAGDLQPGWSGERGVGSGERGGGVSGGGGQVLNTDHKFYPVGVNEVSERLCCTGVHLPR